MIGQKIDNDTPESILSVCLHVCARLHIHMCLFTYTTAAAEAWLLFEMDRCVCVCVCVCVCWWGGSFLQYFSNLSSESDNNLTKCGRKQTRVCRENKTRCQSSSVSRVSDEPTRFPSAC